MPRLFGYNKLKGSQRSKTWIVLALVNVINVIIGVGCITVKVVLTQREQDVQRTPTTKVFTYLIESLYEKNTQTSRINNVLSEDGRESPWPNDHADENFTNLLKPVAYLCGLNFGSDINVEDRSLTTIRNWAASDSTLLYNGVIYEHGWITVPVSGTYAVYSHVIFHMETISSMPDQGMIFYQRLVHYNAATMEDHTICQDQVSAPRFGGLDNHYPSYIHCCAHMNAGDKLSLKVTHITLLNHHRNWHFFGVYFV